MNILFIGPFRSKAFELLHGDRSFSGLGGQRKKQMVIQALLKSGHNVAVLSTAITHRNFLGWQSVGRHEESFPCGSVSVRHISTVGVKPFSGFLGAVTSYTLGVDVAKEFLADVVVVYNGTLAEMLALKGYRRSVRVPSVLELDDLPMARNRGWNPKPKLDLWSFPKAVNDCSGFILVNADMGVVLNGAPGPRLVLPGVIDDLLIETARSRKAPFSNETRTLVYCSNLSVDRGGDVLLEAIPKLPKGWKVKVAGSGPLYSAFGEMAKAHPDRCEYLGMLAPAQLFPLLCSADCVINTPEKLTRKDSVFPFKIFEYLVSGAHVISPSLPSVGDLEIGWFQRWDGRSDSLAALLERSESDFRNETEPRERTTAVVRERFSVTGAGKQLSALLSAVVGRKGN
jgi:glycosyltransferase involved in cell wall biosynthesis